MGFWELFKYFIIRWFGYVLLHFIGATSPLRFSCRHFEERLIKNGQRFVYAFWHGRLLLLSYTHRRRGINVMVSEHRDGELIAQVIEQMGFGTVRGSTTRGGTRALRALCRVLGRKVGAITPDGPRGPGFKVQGGAVTVAQLSGCPILPVTSAAFPRWQFKSWDRFIVPKPFSCGVVRFGAPIYVPRRLTPNQFEEFRLLLEKRLNRITEEADELARMWFKNGYWHEVPQTECEDE